MKIVWEAFDKDEVLMSYILLSQKTLEIWIHDVEVNPFMYNIGSPHGDSISGRYFNM